MDTHETLYAAIKEHCSMDDAQLVEAGEHGADAGWLGFTYYTDTSRFYAANEDAIWELLEQTSDDMGEANPLALIASFGGAKDVHGHDQFANLLAWFALEEVGRWLADNPQNENEDEEEVETV